MSESFSVRPVILCGGSGSRLWPLSRDAYPKQFLPLLDRHSLLQATWLRVATLARPPIVVTGEAHRFMVAEQLRQVDCQPAAIVLEPTGRNTAPAIAVAALEALREAARAGETDAILLVLPSDHLVGDEAGFRAAVVAAVPAAEAGRLVTFGVLPTAPETGFGYIHAPGDGVRPVEAFVEKPDRSVAEQYLASGRYFWNSGMFLFRASCYLAELERFRPDILAACRAAIADAQRDADFLRLAAATFAACPSESIDYAVMEQTDAAAMLPLDVGWSDVGSWSALWQIAEHDDHGNAHRGDVLARDCRNTLVWADERLVALIGLDDLVVVDSTDALLVARRERVQEVKDIVAMLKSRQRPEAVHHRTVYRPWGSYQSIDLGERFQVKRITVRPGASLSLQLHHRRAEHWVVVSGRARVVRGEDVLELGPDQSTYIPVGMKHRLENIGAEPLQLIEVQSGDYLGEDDIVRFEDAYGRG
ncbi:MAG TPA: mannose-1-phosphate guanylyltransferase/mannose-6-phosphate isomerase [Xanthomonadales bacterium]|nr:mannose-1-phosphate guanylyltransferase/mannose-6-phosphate isomerase [Xanthomonadales bacterium]